MASTYDSAANTGRVRTAGSGIVLAGDRTGSRRRAYRHSIMVRSLRLVMPLAGLLVIGVYSLSIMQTIGWGRGIPKLELPSIVPDDIPMVNPHYDGYTKDGGKYWFTAKTAHQDLKNVALVRLSEITGEMIDAQKAKTHMTAARGLFNNKTNILELYDAIDTAGDNGMKTHLTRATVHTKENIITSNEPVVVLMEAGTVNANTMTARQKTKEYTFVDKVRTFLKAHAPPESPTDPETGIAKAAKPPQTFGNPEEPTDILSNRLDVDEVKKTALFTGNVKAVQGTSTLSAPEMLVNYEGTAAPAGAAAAPGQDGPGSGKVKRILAKGPVVITQAGGQTVTSRAADIDTVNQKTVLEGDVVMLQEPDKKANGDRADFDQAADTILLTGNVVVVQGQNQMKGRRLFYNRKANTMQLTSPSQGAPGRVSSRFQQANVPAPASKAPAAAAADEALPGFAVGSSFKADPKAPVEVESDRVDIDDVQKKAIFTGDVRAVQGESIIRCAELTAIYTGSAGLGADAQGQGKAEPAHVTKMQARKNVVITSKDGQSATGDWADFDNMANTAVLGGNVVMTQGKNVVRGTKLLIDRTTGESVLRTDPTASSASEPMTSSSSGAPGIIVKSGRPSAVFYPNMLKNGASGAKEAVKAGVAGWDTKTAAPPPPP
jgi:LPS export ABC transporter protein LptC